MKPLESMTCRKESLPLQGPFRPGVIAEDTTQQQLLQE